MELKVIQVYKCNKCKKKAPHDAYFNTIDRSDRLIVTCQECQHEVVIDDDVGMVELLDYMISELEKNKESVEKLMD